jgi:hypothetical protein
MSKFAVIGHQPVLELPPDVSEVSLDHELSLFAAETLAYHKPTTIISSLALGWETAVAQAAVESGIPLISIIPHIGRETTGWLPEWRERYYNLLGNSKEVIIGSKKASYTRRYYLCSKWMLENSDATIFLWDGRRYGNTYRALKYANKHKKPVTNVYQKWMEFLNKRYGK